MKNLLFVALFFISAGLMAQEPDVVALTNQGNDAIKAKDYKSAFEAYSKALVLMDQQGKVDTAMIYNTGYCALKSDMNSEAIPYYKKAIVLVYKEVKCYEALGKIYSDLKQLDSMEVALNEGIAKFPKEESLKKFMSLCFLKQGLVFYNEGIDIKAAANKSGWNESDPDKFNAEYTKADSTFKLALPLMEKSRDFDVNNKNTLKALQNIYTSLKMDDKLQEVNAQLEK